MITNNYFFIRIYDFLTNLYFKLIEKIDIKELIVEQINQDANNLLDYECKTGNIAIHIARSKPNAQIIAADNNHKFIRFTKRKKRKNYTRNLEVTNLSNLHTTFAYFDIVIACFVFSAMKLEEIHETLRDIKRMLKERKKLIILDYSKPNNKLIQLYTYIYHKFYHKIDQSIFINLNMKEILKYNGFNEISVHDFGGAKLITSIKDSV